LLNVESFGDLQLLENIHGDVSLDGAQGSVDFLLVLLAGFDVMELVSDGRTWCMIDGRETHERIIKSRGLRLSHTERHQQQRRRAKT
jgi:hypothetical protein